MKGRKTKYTPERVNEICEMIQADSYTIPEICHKVGISHDTYHRWKNEKSDFSESIKKAESLQNRNMLQIATNSMRRKLEGYDYVETKTVNKNIKVGKDKDDNPVYKAMKVEETTTTKHIAPSDTMIIFTLKNLNEKVFGENKEPENKDKVVKLKFSFGDKELDEMED